MCTSLYLHSFWNVCVVVMVKVTGLLSNGFCSQIYTNGYLSFNYWYWIPQRLSLSDVPLIAPFWVRFLSTGNIFYRQTNDTILLQRARDQLQELFPSSGKFTPTTLFIATWDRVAQRGVGSQVSACMS